MSRKLEGLIIAVGALAVLTVPARASPRCLKYPNPFALTGDIAVWTMYAAPGSECIQGLRWSYMQIFNVSVSKAPTKGKVVIVGPGFRYFADPDVNDADTFTLQVVGKNRRDPGQSTLEIVVKPPSQMLANENPQQVRSIDHVAVDAEN